MISHFFKTIWIAVRSFSLGLLVGLLVAPNKGSETRRIVQQRLLNLFDQTLPTGGYSRGSPAHQQGGILEKAEYWESGAAPKDRPAHLEGNRQHQRGESGQA